MTDSERDTLITAAAVLRRQAEVLEQLAILPAIQLEPGKEGRCAKCFGMGVNRESGDYCDCPMGRDRRNADGALRREQRALRSRVEGGDAFDR